MAETARTISPVQFFDKRNEPKVEPGVKDFRPRRIVETDEVEPAPVRKHPQRYDVDEGSPDEAEKPLYEQEFPDTWEGAPKADPTAKKRSQAAKG